MDNNTILVKRGIIKNDVLVFILWLCWCRFISKVGNFGLSELVFYNVVGGLILITFIIAVSGIWLNKTKSFYENLYNSVSCEDDIFRIKLSIGELRVKQKDLGGYIFQALKGGFVFRIPVFNWFIGIDNAFGILKIKKKLLATKNRTKNLGNLKVADAVVQLDSKSRQLIFRTCILIASLVLGYIGLDFFMENQIGNATNEDLIVRYGQYVLVGVFASFYCYAMLLRQLVDYKNELPLPEDLGSEYLYQIATIDVVLNKSDVELNYDKDNEILTTTIKEFKYISHVSKKDYENFVGKSNFN